MQRLRCEFVELTPEALHCSGTKRLSREKGEGLQHGRKIGLAGLGK
jgi:hypothetical protein